jgi:hypothetical protein
MILGSLPLSGLNQVEELAIGAVANDELSSF